MVQADAQVEAQVSETLRIHGRIQAGGGGVTVSHGELHEQGSHNTFWQRVKRRPEYLYLTTITGGRLLHTAPLIQMYKRVNSWRAAH